MRDPEPLAAGVSLEVFGLINLSQDRVLVEGRHSLRFAPYSLAPLLADLEFGIVLPGCNQLDAKGRAQLLEPLRQDACLDPELSLLLSSPVLATITVIT